MKITMQVAVEYSFQDLRNAYQGEAAKTLAIIDERGMVNNFMKSIPGAWAANSFTTFDMQYWLTDLRDMVLDFISWAPDAYEIENKTADTMPIYTPFDFSDYLRTASGDAKKILQLMAEAGQQDDFMQYMRFCWGTEPRTREQIDQWIVNNQQSIYKEMDVYPV